MRLLSSYTRPTVPHHETPPLASRSPNAPFCRVSRATFHTNGASSSPVPQKPPGKTTLPRSPISLRAPQALPPPVISLLAN
ncbi:hypothetical protein B0H12DRAFT_785711 [Mycena haematopus]|nr:hypothetical protein B0H12DRAFT_785711 [Mycena haematopus]